jgi:hypothetical protein
MGAGRWWWEAERTETGDEQLVSQEGPVGGAARSRGGQS